MLFYILLYFINNTFKPSQCGNKELMMLKIKIKFLFLPVFSKDHQLQRLDMTGNGWSVFQHYHHNSQQKNYVICNSF